VQLNKEANRTISHPLFDSNFYVSGFIFSVVHETSFTTNLTIHVTRGMSNMSLEECQTCH